jgi:hypothetical protein
MQPDAFAALPLAGNQAYETHGYSFGSKVDFVLIEIYSDPKTADAMSARQVTHDGFSITLDVGDQQVENIRGTQKLYIIHDDTLETYNLDCTDGDVGDVVGSIPGFASVSEFTDFCVEKLTAGKDGE